MKTDKRIKGCPNSNCEEHRNREKYKPTDRYCKLCGTPLIFVCSRCYAEIPDEGIDRRKCKRCEEHLSMQKKKIREGAKGLAEIGRDVVPNIMNVKIAKDVAFKAGEKAVGAARNLKKLK